MPDVSQENISNKLSHNKQVLSERMGIDISFDIVLREFKIANKDAALLFVDGFVDDEVVTLIMQTLLDTKREEAMPDSLEKVFKQRIPYVDVKTVSTYEDIVSQVMAGPIAVLIDGEREAIIMDTRTYPARDPEEPEIEKITRGARDGFVETLLFNVTLLRRRIRDPQMRSEALRIGKRSSNDVALVYMGDVANPQVVDNIRQKLQNLTAEALPMAEKTVEEFMTRTYWNPFPEVRYTERPDVASVHLLEGHVLVIVDNSPSVMIAPVTFFHHLTHAEEYSHDAIVGVYIRWLRFLGVLFSVILVPLWMLLVLEPQLAPPALDFIGPEEEYSLPIALQFIIAHFGIDLLRMASVHTPSAMATALGLVGGLLIGEIAVEVGLLVPEVLLYMGLVAIGIFVTPSWELSMANRIVLFLLIVLTGLFQIHGFLAGVFLVFLRLVTTRSFGFPYLWPLIPLNLRALLNVMVRVPLPVQSIRPEFLKPIDKKR